MTIDAVKMKLSSHCGTPGSDMLLQLRDNNGMLIAILADAHRKLGFYSPRDGYVIWAEPAPSTLMIWHLTTLNTAGSMCCRLLCNLSKVI